MSVKNIRIDQFKEVPSGIIYGLSTELAECAFSELLLSLNDRRGEVVRDKNTHYSNHAIGSIVLLATAFDAWLNEIISHSRMIDGQIIDLADRPTMDKYYRIPEKITKKELPPNTDLDLLIKVRDEIVHFLPRTIKRTGLKKNVPQYFDPLYKKGLLLISNNQDSETPLGLSLCSYCLAYWAWRTVEISSNNLLDIMEDKGIFFRHSSQKFNMYAKITPPEELHLYDEKHNLKLLPY